MPHTNHRPAAFSGPLHGILLAFPVALYASALVADIAYLNTAEVQWTNFAQWLIAGADFFAGLVLAWALIGLLAGGSKPFGKIRLIYPAVILVMFLLGMTNAFQHARDGWHSVGTTGLLLSIACTVLALIAAFLAYGRTASMEEVR